MQLLARKLIGHEGKIHGYYWSCSTFNVQQSMLSQLAYATPHPSLLCASYTEVAELLEKPNLRSLRSVRFHHMAVGGGGDVFRLVCCLDLQRSAFDRPP